MALTGNELWQAALDDLRRQMTQATFDSWLHGSMARSNGDGRLVVGVRNQYAVDWLENRLLPTIVRTVGRVASRPVDVRFEILETSPVERQEQTQPQIQEQPPAAPRFVLPAFDVHEAGWFPVSEYECRFWAPLLGRVAWRVWEIVRRADKRKKKTPWTPSRRWTAPALAEMVPCGRQAILGVDRACEAEYPGAFAIENGQWRYHQPGAFDRLQEVGVAVIERQGQKRHTVYWISVRTKLGLLLPGLVPELSARLQVQHDRWLEDHGFEPADWRIF